jgi:hypothetical protein
MTRRRHYPTKAYTALRVAGLICSGVLRDGRQCTTPALEGSRYCGRHQNQDQAESVTPDP